jgi:ankyrin repeat protein
LHEAAKCASVTAALELLKYGADMNREDSLARTPLFYAAQVGSADMVTILISHGAKITKSDWYWRSPLHEAVLNGYLPVVRVLLTHWDPDRINTPDAGGDTALSHALNTSAEEICVSLLEAGAGVRISDVPRVLNFASKRVLRAIARMHSRPSDCVSMSLVDELSSSTRSSALKLLRKLLDCGLQVYSQKSDGTNTVCKAIEATFGRPPPYLNPFRFASEDYEPFRAAGRLYDSESDDPFEGPGEHPLINNPHATPDTETVAQPPPTGAPGILLQHGALCRQSSGVTCLHNLAFYRSSEAVSDLATLLTEAKCNLEAQDPDGRTPFLHALHLRNVKLASALLKLGANPRLYTMNEPGFLDCLDLKWIVQCEVACQDHDYGGYAKSLEELLGELLEKGLSINLRGRNLQTMLHRLCSTRLCEASVHVMAWILKLGGDVAIKNEHGDTPLHVLFGNNEFCNRKKASYFPLLIETIKRMVQSMSDVNIRNPRHMTPYDVLVGQDTRLWSLKDIRGYDEILLSLQSAGAVASISGAQAGRQGA